jgi:hypothetical protein
MLAVQQRKSELANLSLSQTMSKKELHERRMEELKVRFHPFPSPSLLATFLRKPISADDISFDVNLALGFLSSLSLSSFFPSPDSLFVIRSHRTPRAPTLLVTLYASFQHHHHNKMTSWLRSLAHPFPRICPLVSPTSFASPPIVDTPCFLHPSLTNMNTSIRTLPQNPYSSICSSTRIGNTHDPRSTDARPKSVPLSLSVP